MTANGHPSPQIGVQLSLAGDGCPQCGVPFLLTAVGVPVPKGLVIPATAGKSNEFYAKAAWRYTLCMNCLYRSKMVPDENDQWVMETEFRDTPG